MANHPTDPGHDDAEVYEPRHVTRTVLTRGGVYSLTCTCGWKATAPTTRSAERGAAEHRAANR